MIIPIWLWMHDDDDYVSNYSLLEDMIDTMWPKKIPLNVFTFFVAIILFIGVVILLAMGLNKLVMLC